MALDEYRSGIVAKVNIFHGRVKNKYTSRD